MKRNVFIIAEAGVNHNGKIDLAKQLIDIAHEACANAVKFQTFNADNLVTLNAPKADYQKSVNKPESQYQMLKELELSLEQQIELSNYCDDKNILFLSSPFDLDSVEILNSKIGVPIFKIPSGEITNLPLLIRIAQTTKPVILSTGICSLSEIETALGILAYGYLYPNQSLLPSLTECKDAYISQAGQSCLADKVSILHCISEYPAPYDQVNLRAIATLNHAFNLPIGYSDHTEGIAISLAAVAMGATIIEKHFTIDKSLPGPDHKASLEPVELKSLVEQIRQIEAAMGNGVKIPSKAEFKNKNVVRRSLVAKLPIKKNEVFTEKNLACKRPGTGVSSLYFSDFIGKQAHKDYCMDEEIIVHD